MHRIHHPSIARAILPRKSPSIRRYGLVPVVVESGVGGERSFDIYSRLLRERISAVLSSSGSSHDQTLADNVVVSFLI